MRRGRQRLYRTFMEGLAAAGQGLSVHRLRTPGPHQPELLDQPLGRLAPTQREGAGRVPLRGNPGIVKDRQRGDARGEHVAILRSKARECLHAELNTGDVLVRRHPLDFGDRQMVGADIPHDAVRVHVPGGGSVAGDRVFLDIAVMQIGEAQIIVGGAVTGQVVTRPEPFATDEFEPSLEGVADIGVAPLYRRAPIDQEDRNRLDMLVLSVRQRNFEGSGVHRQLQRTSAGDL